MAGRPGRRVCGGTGAEPFIQARVDGRRVTCPVCGRDDLVIKPGAPGTVPRHYVEGD